MTISAELTHAIFALDAYNRGYVPDGQTVLGGVDSVVGNHTLIMQSATAPGSAAVAASFYAAAYKDDNGNIVISYRGTDAPAEGDITAWTGGSGFQTKQSELAA